jgi:hypothetical protein
MNNLTVLSLKILQVILTAFTLQDDIDGRMSENTMANRKKPTPNDLHNITQKTKV